MKNLSQYNENRNFVSRFVGSPDFYKRVVTVALPIIIQNLISNFVNLLDNIMVGRIGTDQMNGVSIVNQLMFVFMLAIWGAVSGAGIFTAQFFGKGDHEGVRSTFRAKMIFVLSVAAGAIALFLWKGEYFIQKFIHDSDGIGNAELTLSYGKGYLDIMLVGLIPVAVSNAYANTLRDIGETSVPMKSGIIAVGVNLVLNYVLIFGHLGFPEMGVNGAALATVVSRFVELFINVFWTHFHRDRCRFIAGAYRSFYIPPKLLWTIIVKGTPLALNEFLWSMGITFLNQSYSVRGLSVIAALNIASTISNLFNGVFLGIGESISIVVGQLLGAGRRDEARDTARKTIALSVSTCFAVGLLLVCFKDVFPMIYKTEAEVRTLASYFILVSACFMPLHACLHGCYFTIRSGGKTFITFLFDSAYVWCIAVPVARILSGFTSLPIVPLYVIVQSIDVIKVVIGVVLVKKGIWVNNIVGD